MPESEREFTGITICTLELKQRESGIQCVTDASSLGELQKNSDIWWKFDFGYFLMRRDCASLWRLWKHECAIKARSMGPSGEVKCRGAKWGKKYILEGGVGERARREYLFSPFLLSFFVLIKLEWIEVQDLTSFCLDSCQCLTNIFD